MKSKPSLYIQRLTRVPGIYRCVMAIFTDIFPNALNPRRKTVSSHSKVLALTPAPIRPLQDVILGVFKTPCLRPESPALYPSSLLINHDSHGQKLGREQELKQLRDDFQDGNKGCKDPGQRGDRRPEEL